MLRHVGVPAGISSGSEEVPIRVGASVLSVKDTDIINGGVGAHLILGAGATRRRCRLGEIGAAVTTQSWPSKCFSRALDLVAKITLAYVGCLAVLARPQRLETYATDLGGRRCVRVHTVSHRYPRTDPRLSLSKTHPYSTVEQLVGAKIALAP